MKHEVTFEFSPGDSVEVTHVHKGEQMPRLSSGYRPAGSLPDKVFTWSTVVRVLRYAFQPGGVWNEKVYILDQDCPGCAQNVWNEEHLCAAANLGGLIGSGHIVVR